MKIPFSHETTRYARLSVDTPYQKAGQIWDDRLGIVYAQMTWWRRTSILLLLLSFIVMGLFFILFKRYHPRVYVAEIAHQGRVINVTPLTETYQPTKAQIEYFVAQFVRQMRGLPLDPVIAKKNWLQAYHYLSARSEKQFNHYFSTRQPEKLLGKETIDIKILQVSRLSAHTYQMTWQEKTVNQDGKLINTENYNGIFTISFQTPKTQQAILSNPLGIHIINFQITKEGGGNE